MSAPRPEDRLQDDLNHYKLEQMITYFLNDRAEEFELSYHKVNLPLFDGIRNVFDSTALLVRAGYGDKLIKPRNGSRTFIIEAKASRLIEALPLVLHIHMTFFGEQCLYVIWDQRRKPQHLGFWVTSPPRIQRLMIPKKTQYPKEVIDLLKLVCVNNDLTKISENVNVPTWASGDPFLILDWSSVTADWHTLLRDYLK